MSHGLTWGVIENDRPIVLVHQRSASRKRQASARGGARERLQRLPHAIGLVLVLATSALAMFDLYLLASSALR